MEFFAQSPITVDSRHLQRCLRIDTLPQGCRLIDRVLRCDGGRGEIYCLWGQFLVHREEIRGGVRFSLPGCPNALAWTITTGEDEAAGGLLIHCTINRQTHEPDFVASIEDFVAAWRDGLPKLLSRG